MADNYQSGGRPNRGRNPMPPEEKQFDERVVNVDRVARVVKGGRRFRFRVLVVVGDRKGKVGIGIGKGADVTSAVTKAVDEAKKNFITVQIEKNTIPHDVEAKVGGAKILIMPASQGTGLIAGGTIRTILEVAGVSNVLSKSFGSSNKINTSYATIEALSKLTPSKQWITRRDAPKTSETKVAAKKTDKKVAVEASK